MGSNVTFGHLIVILVIVSSYLLPEFVSCKIQIEEPMEPIESGGIKNELGTCTKKKGPEGSNREYCYIKNTHPEVLKYFETEQEKTGKTCKKFKISDFDKNSPSIMYGESSGRLGNQLLGYAMLLQLGYVGELLVKTFKPSKLL